MLVPIPSGEDQGGIYLVEFDEDLWKSYDLELQEYCKAEWRKKATPIAKCRFVLLRLYPDPLFPTHGHEKPYTEWQEPIEHPDAAPFTVDTTIYIRLRNDAVAVDPAMRPAITQRLGEVGQPGAAWRIVTPNGTVLESGKL